MECRKRRPFRLGVPTLGVLLASACAPAAPPPVEPTPAPAPEPPAPETSPGLPPVPFVQGPLEIRVVHPPRGTVRPNTDSVFVYGSVGRGDASLDINGTPVYVEPNGAFLAFVRRPRDDVLRLTARAGAERAEATVAYVPPPPPALGSTPRTLEYAAPQFARVTGGADTLATGSDVTIGRPTPTGTYRWFLPRGAELILTGERGDMVRARLDPRTEAWFPRDALTIEGLRANGESAPRILGVPSIVGGTGWSDVRIPAGAAPFRVEAMDTLVLVTLHNVQAGLYQRIETQDAAVAVVETGAADENVATVRIFPTRRFWGFKAFYEPDGTLVVRVREPPAIDPAEPLRGLRIVVDPGHPPGGAVGPTGLAEADANLEIALRLAQHLWAAGAEVILTRSTPIDVALGDRVALAVQTDAHLLVSVHNNAFPEGVNPYRRYGTSTYYFHPLSAPFAKAMNDALVETTQIRDLGAIRDNLALVRPTWMPAVLTESLFMPIPQQEAALRDPDFIDALAAAHVRGIERFLRASAGASGSR